MLEVAMLFTKSSKLDNVLYDVRGPVVDEAIISQWLIYRSIYHKAPWSRWDKGAYVI